MILFSSCLWCREVIAQARPGAPWSSDDDEHHCSGLGIEHEPNLVTHKGCDILHASALDARFCAQRG